MDATYPVSVVVPTFDGRSRVERLLAALSRQSLPADDFEVVVAVDGSRDGTEQAVETAGGRVAYRVRTVSQPNRGRAAACNLGVRAAGGEVIVILDDDMEPAPECLAAHRRAQLAGTDRCVMGPVPIRLPDRPTQLQRYIARKFAAHHRRMAAPGHEFTLRDFYTGNVSIRRQLLLDLGLFDEAFALYGNEDLELAARARRAGVTIEFVEAASARQTWDKDPRALARDTVAKGRTAVLLATKHPEVVTELQLAAYDRGARWWRLARSVLLAPGVASTVPAALPGLAEALERVRFPRMRLFYLLFLDYFYWVGVRTALRERGFRSGRPPDARRLAAA